jgi:YVTN family beta-propeller protein
MKVSTRVFLATTVLVVGVGWLSSAEEGPAVVDTVYVGHGAEEIAVNPLTQRAFVAILDLAGNDAIGTIPLFPLFPEDVSLDCLNNRIHVGARVRFHYPDPGLVVVVDGVSESVLGFAPIGVGRIAMAFNPFTNRLYTIASRMPGMAVLEGGTGTVLDRVPGPLCRDIGVDSLANHIYLTDHSDRVLALDAGYRPIAAPFCVDDGMKLAVDTPSCQVFVTQYSEDQLTVIDGATCQSAAVAVGDEPRGLAVNPMTGRAYVANHRSGTVSVIDGDAVVATVPVGPYPRSVAVNPLTGLVYVVNAGDGTLSVIEDAYPAFLPDRFLFDIVGNLMIEAGGAGGPLQDALGFIEAGDYDKAAHSVLTFSEEIEGQTMSPEHGEKLATVARRIIVMMIGN